ncbi:MAG: alanine--tRNA ligase [Spirochaetes bacterium GWF1_41_5]|nr:MAG: alanine--tRNA ligase [Spirochaetes bacterium GWF1_41_5]
MTHNEIRASFLEFFRKKNHLIVPSASLVPQADPTLIFTNAGMNQFKDIFLGLKPAEKKRMADTQKCIRVSGKHNDLEEVGFDTYHHTFFEMLGNWSFGDYYKKEAIMWAWELLTDVWKLPGEKLYATVYKNDDEAFEFWKTATDINPEHILRFGEKDNFWEMGETGPCGPCSEIHIDLGAQRDPDPKAWVNSGSARFIEIWNLVFIQYNRGADGKLAELPSKHVDTGMGFERISSILQKVSSNYDTDIFRPIIAAAEELSRKNYSGENIVPMRVIADHIRTIVFSLSDGVIPSNEGRGYVIRRILRRAVRYGTKLGFNRPFLHEIAGIVCKIMKEAFPELQKNFDYVKKLIISEEESFFKTIERGTVIFQEIADSPACRKSRLIPGDQVFLLHDTFGFPPDLTRIMAREKNLEIDENGYNKEMEKQKTMGREARGKTTYDTAGILKSIGDITGYKGDDCYEISAKCIGIIKDQILTDEIFPGESAGLVFNETVFYGESGGQEGDAGNITGPDILFEVTGAVKTEGYIIHNGIMKQGKIKTGSEYSLSCDREKRIFTRKNHSATHLLQKALRTVLGDHIRQSGSRVNDKKLRFDFNHFSALSSEQIGRIEEEVYRAVLADWPVTCTEMTKNEAEKSGALAFFEEKYGERVRVVKMGDYSMEFCGGSHVKSTGEIGYFRITSESSSASGIRRIEAVTGMEAWYLAEKDKQILARVLDKTGTGNHEQLLRKIDSLLAENRELKKKSKTADAVKNDFIPEKAGSVQLVYDEFSDTDSSGLRAIIDNLKNQAKENLAVFFTVKNPDKITFLCGLTADLTQKYHAGNLVNMAAGLCGGKGGGRADFAQAGGKNSSRLSEIPQAVKNYFQGSQHVQLEHPKQ